MEMRIPKSKYNLLSFLIQAKISELSNKIPAKGNKDSLDYIHQEKEIDEYVQLAKILNDAYEAAEGRMNRIIPSPTKRHLPS